MRADRIMFQTKNKERQTINYHPTVTIPHYYSPTHTQTRLEGLPPRNGGKHVLNQWHPPLPVFGREHLEGGHRQMSSFFFNIKSCTVIKCFDINKPYHEFLQGSDKELYDTCSTRGQRKRTFNEVS